MRIGRFSGKNGIVLYFVGLFLLIFFMTPLKYTYSIIHVLLYMIPISYLFILPILILTKYESSDKYYTYLFVINCILSIVLSRIKGIFGIFFLCYIFIGIPLYMAAKKKEPLAYFKFFPGGSKKIFNEYGTTTGVPASSISIDTSDTNNESLVQNNSIVEPVSEVNVANTNTNPTYVLDGGVYKCLSCNQVINNNDKFCIHCGAQLNVSPSVNSNPQLSQSVPSVPFVPINGTNFGDYYYKSEDELLTGLIYKNLEAAGINPKNKLIPTEILMRKTIMTLIFAFLLFIYISSFFFHFPNYTYIIGGIIVVLVSVTLFNYNFIAYLKKEIKARPSEKMSNVIMSIKNDMVRDRSYITSLISIMVAIIVPIIIFANPVILYEKSGEGYGVRFYAYGWKNNTTAVIPSEHKGKPVVSLRGNTFSNMKKLKEVELPDTITEIRGQAFLNCYKLESIKLPKNLVSLGGSAFKNCTSLKSIELPDSLTTMGGEVFMNAVNLESVKLSKNLVEIRGDSFNSTAVSSIEIPDSVVRIGGGAFKNCTYLTDIIIPDTVEEIGGEAFMYDVNLSTIKLPSKITEIRGDTFNGCRSLKTIDIPDSVTRIGGHAFENCGLVKVNINSTSSLTEIGSSGFRSNYYLSEIHLPKNCTYESNSFKENNTKIYRYN